MAFRTSFIRFDKIIISTLGILFGIVALVVVYEAVSESTEQRSKAAETQTIYKQWEFNGTIAEGWTVVAPNTAVVKNGAFVVSMTRGTRLPAFRNTSVSSSLPTGLKTVWLSMAVGAPQVPTGGQIGKIIPTIEEVNTGTDDAVFQQSVNQKIICVMDAKLCEDGSSVSRTGPKCEFELCPTGGSKTQQRSPRKFTGLLYYSLADKNQFEKPVKFEGIVDGKFQRYSLVLPDIGPIDVAKLRVVFTSGIKVRETVSVDSIRLLGSVTRITPTPTLICKTGVNSFSVDTECLGGFQYMTFRCYDGFGRREGGPSSCKSSEVWSSYAQQNCAGRSNCSLTPTPTRSYPPTPTPYVSEYPTSTPTPTPFVVFSTYTPTPSPSF